MNVTVERKTYFQLTATYFGFTNKPSSVCAERWLFNTQHASFKYGCCMLKTFSTLRDVMNEFDNISCCTIFIIYLLLLYVSVTGHSHLQGATRILDLHSIYYKYSYVNNKNVHIGVYNYTQYPWGLPCPMAETCWSSK